ERPDERDDEREDRGESDQHRVRDPPSRVLVRPVAEREPEHEREEGEPVEDRVQGAGADEACERHNSILPITKPAAKAVPTTVTRTKVASAKIETISPGLYVAELATEIRQKVQGTRDEHGPFGARELARAGPCSQRFGRRLDPLEVGGAERGELGGRQH